MNQDFVLKTPPVYVIECKEAFDALNLKEKTYLHHVCEAGWIGATIDALQLSPESPGILLMAQKIFMAESCKDVCDSAKKAGLCDETVNAVMAYFASVYGNLGNYYSFGDSKFTPNCEEKDFETFVTGSKAYKTTNVKNVFERIIKAIYSTVPRCQRLAFNPDGISTYYSSNFLKSDTKIIQDYLKFAKLESYNTRAVKVNDSETKYFILVASEKIECKEVTDWPGLPEGVRLYLKFGDFSSIMSLLVQACKDCENSSLTDFEKEMWKYYGESFFNGSIESHKQGSRAWIKDKSPIVENYIGFIESYRDPLGVRAEFESFAAIVNKNKSEKFQVLVDKSEEFISQLPWPKEYEKDQFLRPDFTSLDIVSFASSGIPVGINIPNYDDIRQSEGFKNVSLGNVLEARFNDPQVTFIAEADKSLYLKQCGNAFNVQVGLHELLGHGSGKLFKCDTEGKFNFDKASVKDIHSGGPVEKWYEPGESWDSKFSDVSSAYEECRAECVGIYLCSLPQILSVFGHTTAEDCNDVAYINWLLMCRSGIVSMEFYTPHQGDGMGAWRQAHCHARYVITRVLMEADPALVQINVFTAEDGKPDLNVTIDRSKIMTVGREAIGAFLTKLQYYKSTGNATDGIPFFLSYSKLTAEHLKFREIVLSRKRPRNIYVQPVTKKSSNGEVSLHRYDASFEGVVQSYVDRYGPESKWGSGVLNALEKCWDEDAPYHSDIPY